MSAAVMRKNDGVAWWFWVFAMLFVVVAVERVYGIDRQSLWSDELYAVMASYKPFSGAWKMMLVDSHPPGYLTFMWLTLPITGYSDFGVRLHALLFGLLWMPLVFWVCRRWFSVQAALIAAAVVASAYNAVYYSQEARAYSMLIAFNLLNIICFLEIVFSPHHTKWHRIGFIASATAMLYLHYSGFVFLCAEMLLCGLLWLMRFRINVKTLCIIFSVPLLLYSPWLGVMYDNLVNAPRSWSVSAVPTAAETYNTLQRLLAPDDKLMRLHVYATGLILLCALIQHCRRGVSTQLLVVYSFIWLTVVPVLAFYVESLVATPLFEKRYFLTAVALEAALIGWVCGEGIFLLHGMWQRCATVLVVIWLTILIINTNIASGLYSSKGKDPVREAIEIIKDDVRKNSIEKPYTIIMSRKWFEHYVRYDNLSFDPDWRGRYYGFPHQIMDVERYLGEHKDKVYLYYVMLRQPVTNAALVSLKQRYKLLSHASVSIEAGTFDVFKFKVREAPSAEQLKEMGSNPYIEIANLVASDVAQKDPSTYHILLTHDWMQTYLQRSGVVMDGNPSDYQYGVSAQADSVYRYINSHPSVDTLFYLALQESNTEEAKLMLRLQYHLVSETTFDVLIGKMSVLKFNVKEAPVQSSGTKN